MNEAKHTPGPWKVHVRTHQKRGGKEYKSRSIWREGSSGAMRHIADAKGDIGPPDVSDANAQLIAAAPDLLAACGAAFHALKSYEYGNSAPDLAQETAEAVRAAIEKATGGQNATTKEGD